LCFFYLRKEKKEMRTEKIKDLDVDVPKGSAFTIETPPMMPKAHVLAAVVAPRGYGKGCITCSFIQHMRVVDRLILVSPSAASNKALNDKLRSILAPEDIFTDPNDISVLDRIVDLVEKERDDYEAYWEKKKKYEALMKTLESDTPLFQIPSSELMAAFDGEGFTPPVHRWNGNRPVIMVWMDDVMGSDIMSGRGARKLSSLCMKHRHLGALAKGGAIGVSLIFNMQSYKSAQGGIPKALRANLTLLLLGKTKSERELLEIAEEFGSEVGVPQFMEVYKLATVDPHSFLMIDLHPKRDHPSMFRKNLSEFIIL